MGVRSGSTPAMTVPMRVSRALPGVRGMGHRSEHISATAGVRSARSGSRSSRGELSTSVRVQTGLASARRRSCRRGLLRVSTRRRLTASKGAPPCRMLSKGDVRVGRPDVVSDRLFHDASRVKDCAGGHPSQEFRKRIRKKRIGGCGAQCAGAKTSLGSVGSSAPIRARASRSSRCRRMPFLQCQSAGMARSTPPCRPRS